MRFKRRYFCVEIVFPGSSMTSEPPTPDQKLKPSDLVQEISRSIEKFYGDLGVASMQPSFSLVHFNADTSVAIFRIARDQRAPFHHLLTLTSRVNSVELTFKVIHVSGSIRQCKKHLLDHSNRKLEELADNLDKIC